MKRIVLWMLILFLPIYSHSKTVKYYQHSDNILIGGYSEIFTDTADTCTIQDVMQTDKFVAASNTIPNLGISSKAFWVKFTIQNESDLKELLLEYGQVIVDEISIYVVNPQNNKIVYTYHAGEQYKFSKRMYDYPTYIFSIPIQKGETKNVYLHLKSGEEIVVPVTLGSATSILDANHDKGFIFGMYSGIIFVMFFFNLFIYFTLKDSIYLKYVIYVFSIGMAQASLFGYSFQYLWPTSPWMANQSVYLFSCIASISALEFAKTFLQMKTHTPILYKGSFIFTFAYIVTEILSLAGYFNISYFLVLTNAGLICAYILMVAIVIFKRGFKPALFFLIAWTPLLLGIIISVLKDFDILPANNFTNYTMVTGTALEVILLSFALADRINILKREKEESQAQVLQALLQNELIIKNQNILLEKKVEERTKELSDTIADLKQTQQQLVSSEKMASLGHLTAGIAHEINNPINYVVSNVKPLKKDLEDIYELIQKYENIDSLSGFQNEISEINSFKNEIDYAYLKKEIGSLLQGIEDGAGKTADIVQGLKAFSRTDEKVFKRANILDGINSSLTLLNTEFSGASIEVIKNFSDLPQIECYPGKLNQVFMNILNNAVFSIKENKERKEKGRLIITAYADNHRVHVSFKDNGTGIPDDVKAKVFEPFFSTKEAGKGAGLGMSIAFEIIREHNGDIQLHTEYGGGSEFVVSLPVNYTR
ncbi:7TM diverse intracellular signaling domain-containing protein [Flavobacterium sp.]|uniref:sensor histidine kinase n=1 Tax=Flavobacterium sp. TaxID=239 RepID=UPI0025C2E159|nr:7TM diverse intracellular signaling domain-containing protein [Flavobacterium sp.]